MAPSPFEWAAPDPAPLVPRVCPRLVKELRTYVVEVEKQKEVVEKMRADGRDSHDIKQQVGFWSARLLRQAATNGSPPRCRREQPRLPLVARPVCLPVPPF